MRHRHNRKVGRPLAFGAAGGLAALFALPGKLWAQAAEATGAVATQGSGFLTKQEIWDAENVATGGALDPTPVLLVENAFGGHQSLLWVLLAAGLVYFMQAGFLAFEVGNVRAKNTAATAMKNLGDWVVISLIFFLIGYGLMFGHSESGYVGTTLFGGDGFGDDPWQWTKFLFQLAFAGTAATIVSGAMAERTGFKAYLVFTVGMGALIYPVYGHWVWSDNGWLAQMEFHDFAGASVVHLVGAVASFVGVSMVGPRLGRYASDGSMTRLEINSPAWSALGIIILWFGWWGFNGGSTLRFDATVLPIIVKTNIAAAAGAVVAFVHCSVFQKRSDIQSKFLGGALGGLVAITAGADTVQIPGAFVIGAVAGVLHNVSFDLVLKRWRLDDVCGAIPVHGFCGIWGLLAVPVFSSGGDMLKGLGVQALGVGVCVVWTAVTSFIVLAAVKQLVGLRVAPMREIRGLGIGEDTALEEEIDEDFERMLADAGSFDKFDEY